jgi:hypothetical protein
MKIKGFWKEILRPVQASDCLLCPYKKAFFSIDIT